jgi:hypothetical protein
MLIALAEQTCRNLVKALALRLIVGVKSAVDVVWNMQNLLIGLPWFQLLIE